MRVASLTGILILLIITVAQGTSYSQILGTVTSIGPQHSTTYSDPSSNDWPTYHKDLVRSGYDSVFPQFSSISQLWKSVPLDGDVYAEPLVVGTAVVVATEGNSLYELNASTGLVVWHTNLGNPVNGGLLPCGDINPSGITGTPVIDVAGRTIFTVAFLRATNGTLYHELFAVNLDTGTVKFQFPVDPQGANPLYQQQRAALALSNGYVYVAYGGLDGDCGPYHGWLVGTKSSGGGQLVSYQVPTGRAGAIWGGGDGPAVDSSGNLLVATGNSDSTSTFDFGDSMIKLSPASSGPIAVVDWFAPSNWASLNAADLDLGSTEPVILSSSYLFQIGKEGVGYVLNAANMGHVGGQLYSTPVCGSGHGAYGGLAYSPPYLAVPCDNGIVLLKMNLGSTPSFSVVWHGPNYLTGPPIIAGNVVWDVGPGSLYAFSISGGQTIFQASIGSLPTHFNSLSASGGQIFVTAHRQLIAYVTQPLQLTVTPQSPQNGLNSDSTYLTLQVKVTNPSAAAVAGANVTVYVNGTAICSNMISSTSGLASCPFEVTSPGTYYWNATANGAGYAPAVAPQTTFTFTAGPVVQEIPLVQGWNLISTAVVPANTALGKVLASQVAGTNFTAVWSYQNGKWVFATLAGGIVSGSLTIMQDGFAYWIYMTKPDHLFVVGSVIGPPPATPSTYSLNLGWNLIGFKPQPQVQSETVGVYLSSISGSYDVNNVWVYDNAKQSWVRASASYILQPGQGIWVLTTATATLKP